jgi:hypothetical protein
MRIKLSLKEYLESPLTYLAVVMYLAGSLGFYGFVTVATPLFYGFAVFYAFMIMLVFGSMIRGRAFERLVKSVVPTATFSGKEEVAVCPYCGAKLHKGIVSLEKSKATCSSCGRIFRAVQGGEIDP